MTKEIDAFYLTQIQGNPVIRLYAKNTWLPAYDVTFDLAQNTYKDGKSSGELSLEVKEKFVKVLFSLRKIPEPQAPTRRVKIDCNYKLNLFGRELEYTNYTFQINPELTKLQRALLEMADACGLKVY